MEPINDMELSKPLIRSTKGGNSPWLLVLVFVMLLGITAFIVIPPIMSKDVFVQNFIVLDSNKPLTSPEAQEFPTVETKNGIIRGVFENGIRVFHGVPFAEPPVGELRWQPPQPRKSWHPKILDATEKKAACLQNPNPIAPVEKMSEDCLYLEIFAPLEVTSEAPVLFYIHGGAFETYSGTDGMFDGTSFAKRTGIIVINVEYRLGAMGFLVHGDENDVQGNYGLLDQAFGLRWVHENIKAFGGDPYKVTIAGQSAGAQSSIIHLLSETSSKYFRSVILESPPVPLPIKTFSQGINQTKLVARNAKCLRDDNNIDIDCLRQTDYQTILKAQKLCRSFGMKYLDRAEPWGPVVDDKLVRGTLLGGFKNGKYVPRKPILWGVTSEEAVIFVRYIQPESTGYLMYVYAKKVFGDIGVDRKRLGKLYPLRTKDSRTVISAMITDFIFRCPVQWAAQQIFNADLPPIWTYVFEKTVTISTKTSFSMCSGHACHGIEIPFVFDTFRSFHMSASDEDAIVSRRIIHYYGNFIWYGNPNGDIHNKGQVNTNDLPHWPRSYEKSDAFQTLVFNKKGDIGVGNGVKKDKCTFWYSQFP